MSENRLVRSADDRVIAGICGGIADYLDIDAILVRILFLLLSLASGVGLVIYLVLWFIMPPGNADEVGTAVIKENLDDMGRTVSNSARRIGQHGIVGVVLISLGVFFLLNQLGWFGWLSTLFWPLVIICAGVLLLSRRHS